jgi:hypothetical protein
LDAIRASAGESRTMYRLIQRLAAQHSLEGAFEDVAEEIGTLIPAITVAVFTPVEDGTELEAKSVAGSQIDWLKGRRVRVGERIVGWSAGSGRSVLNADATGEFGQLGRVTTFPIRSCMTVPITVGAERLGVIAAFSPDENGFKAEDQRIVEAVLRHIVPVLERLRNGSHAGREDSARVAGVLELTPVGMIACRCSSRSLAGTEPIGIALAVIRRHLGPRAVTQIVHGSDIFIGIGTADIGAIERLADELRAALSPAGLIDRSADVVVATTPRDGTTLEHLLYACRQRFAPASQPNNRVH